MAGAAIGKVLAKSLTQGLAKGVGKKAKESVASKVVRGKTTETLRQSGIIETQKAKAKAEKKKGFKEKLKQAKADKQQTFTFDGIRFNTANY